MSGALPAGASARPGRRIVLLGASNIARNLPTVVSAAQRAWGMPLDIVAAFGHGRGYGLKSWVLGRSLPPIVECGLWEALETRPRLPTTALLTDIGNDLVLGAPPERLVEWVDDCLRRLSPGSERLTVSSLPLASLEKLEPWRFRLMRSLFFPRSRLSLEQALTAARHVNDEVIRLAERHGASVVTPQEDWFGFDPIHIRGAAREDAWETMFAPWLDERPARTPATRNSSWYLRRLPPLQRGLFGMQLHRPQPAGCLPDGSVVSLY